MAFPLPPRPGRLNTRQPGRATVGDGVVQQPPHPDGQYNALELGIPDRFVFISYPYGFACVHAVPGIQRNGERAHGARPVQTDGELRLEVNLVHSMLHGRSGGKKDPVPVCPR